MNGFCGETCHRDKGKKKGDSEDFTHAKIFPKKLLTVQFARAKIFLQTVFILIKFLTHTLGIDTFSQKRRSSSVG